MGASAWSYRTPYQENIQKALNELRESEFAQGAFYVRPAFQGSFEDILPRNATEEDRKALWEQYQFWRDEQQPEKFNSIDELLRWNAEDGTHSILDIDTITDVPQVGSAASLTSEQTIQLFGTLTPTREIIDNTSLDKILEFSDEIGRGRYEATYILVYEENKPVEIFFIGFSVNRRGKNPKAQNRITILVIFCRFRETNRLIV